jgi:hypothetical protein
VHEVTVSSLKADKARAVVRRATEDFEAAMRENQTPTERDKRVNHNALEAEKAVAKLKDIGKGMYITFVMKGGVLGLEATAAKVFQDQVKSAVMEYLQEKLHLIGRGPTDAIERLGNALAQAEAAYTAAFDDFARKNKDKRDMAPKVRDCDTRAALSKLNDEVGSGKYDGNDTTESSDADNARSAILNDMNRGRTLRPGDIGDDKAWNSTKNALGSIPTYQRNRPSQTGGAPGASGTAGMSNAQLCAALAQDIRTLQQSMRELQQTAAAGMPSTVAGPRRAVQQELAAHQQEYQRRCH